MLPGNHDNKRGVSNDLFNEYFGPERYEGTPWYGGSIAPGDNSANFSTFERDGAKFLMLSLPYAYGEAEMVWAEGIVTSHPDFNVIISTHEHVMPKTLEESAHRSSNSRWVSHGAELWERVIAPNPNVVIVLSGHFHGLGQLVTENAGGIEGHTVVELLADYQEFRTHTGERATGFFRMLQFDLDQGAIAVDTRSMRLDAAVFSRLRLPPVPARQRARDHAVQRAAVEHRRDRAPAPVRRGGRRVHGVRDAAASKGRGDGWRARLASGPRGPIDSGELVRHDRIPPMPRPTLRLASAALMVAGLSLVAAPLAAAAHTGNLYTWAYSEDSNAFGMTKISQTDAALTPLAPAPFEKYVSGADICNEASWAIADFDGGAIDSFALTWNHDTGALGALVELSVDLADFPDADQVLIRDVWAADSLADCSKLIYARYAVTVNETTTTPLYVAYVDVTTGLTTPIVQLPELSDESFIDWEGIATDPLTGYTHLFADYQGNVNFSFLDIADQEVSELQQLDGVTDEFESSHAADRG